jgi:hypothetical protein
VTSSATSDVTVAVIVVGTGGIVSAGSPKLVAQGTTGMRALCDGSGVGTSKPAVVLALGDVVLSGGDGTAPVAVLPDGAVGVEFPQATTIRAMVAMTTAT